MDVLKFSFCFFASFFPGRMTIGKTGIKQQMWNKISRWRCCLSNHSAEYRRTLHPYLLSNCLTAIKLKQNLVLLRIVYTNKMWPSTKYLKQIVGMLIGSFNHPALKSKIVIGQLEHDINIKILFFANTISASYIRCLWVLQKTLEILKKKSDAFIF